MKILHITASYKPAYIYGGPIYSVSALCEGLEAEGIRLEAEGLRLKAEGLRLKAESEEQNAESINRVEGSKSKVKSSKTVVKSTLNPHQNAIVNQILLRSANYGCSTPTLQVYTTLANGKEELSYQNNETKIVDGVSVTYFKRLTKDHSHFSPALLSHLWQTAKDFDVIHIHSWWNLVSMGAVIICILRGVKPIVSPRGMLGDYTMSHVKSAFHRFFGKYLLRKCDFHATTLMEGKEILQQVFNEKEWNRIENLMLLGQEERIEEQGLRMEEQGLRIEEQGLRSKEERKIYVIHNLVKLPEKLPIKNRVFDGTLKLVFLSRIHHKKGIELLLDTLGSVDFPFHLSIVGEGDLDYVESLKLKVEGLKLQDKVSWYGAVYSDEKYNLLTNHDAFILPSYNENFANVVIEAIAVGTPVLLSEHVGLKDFVVENNFGIVFKLEDLQTDLENFYQLLSEGKFEINKDTLLNKENLIHQYLEMYALSSKF